MTRGLLLLALLSALSLGVGNAGGRSLATVTVTVQVIGKGRVTSESPSGIECGDGKKTCYLAFSAGSTTITLRTHDSADAWHFDNWDGDCSGSEDTCDLSGSSSYEVTAKFDGPATTTSTLSVSAVTGEATVPLSVTVFGQGTITGGGIACGPSASTCSQRETAGSTVTLTATPAPGQTVSGWGGDCSGTPITSSCSLAMNAAKNVTATFTGGGGPFGPGTVPPAAGSGNVAGGSIDCGSGGTACTATVLTGSTLTVVETPDPGFVFDGWSGPCSDQNVSCTVELSEDKSLSASWSESSTNAPHLLTVSISGSGTVEGGDLDCSGPATCTQTIAAGETVTLTARPADGYLFTGWTGTSSCSGTGETCTLTMDADRIVTATFTLAVPLSVSVVGNGGVTGGAGAINCGSGGSVCSGTFAQNATVTLVATPAVGATFVGWSGACGGTATTCTVLLSEARSVTATFTGSAAGAGLPLNVTVTGNGTVTGSGINCGGGASTCTNATLAANATVTLTATPSPGSTFEGWSGACAGTAPTCTVVLTAAKSVNATFTGGTSSVLLSVSVSGAGRVTGGGIDCGSGGSTCAASPIPGSTITLTARPAASATFSGWSGACTGSARSCTVTVSGARSVRATFTGGSTSGKLTIVVTGRGRVSTPLGTCAAVGPQKTCVQQFKPGARTALTATPLRGASFLGWGGSCGPATTKRVCSLVVSSARSVTARFSGAVAGTSAVLASLSRPIVTRAGAGFRVTLRFTTTSSGLARVRGLRAGRVAVALSLRVASGRATIGPFPVAKPGLYAFSVALGGRTIGWRACLGLCGARARAGPFLLTREPPSVTRSGDVWSVTLHARESLISDARVRVHRGSRLLVRHHFLGRAGRTALGPFLLGPGSYTLRLSATDAYGRSRTLTWIVALAR